MILLHILENHAFNNYSSFWLLAVQGSSRTHITGDLTWSVSLSSPKRSLDSLGVSKGSRVLHLEQTRLNYNVQTRTLTSQHATPSPLMCLHLRNGTSSPTGTHTKKLTIILHFYFSLTPFLYSNRKSFLPSFINSEADQPSLHLDGRQALSWTTRGSQMDFRLKPLPVSYLQSSESDCFKHNFMSLFYWKLHFLILFKKIKSLKCPWKVLYAQFYSKPWLWPRRPCLPISLQPLSVWLTPCAHGLPGGFSNAILSRAFGLAIVSACNTIRPRDLLLPLKAAERHLAQEAPPRQRPWDQRADTRFRAAESSSWPLTPCSLAVLLIFLALFIRHHAYVFIFY